MKEIAETPPRIVTAEAARERVQLSFRDAEWLLLLRGRPIDDDWVEAANTAVEIGSQPIKPSTPGGQRQIIRATREEFFGNLLGLGDTEHPAHKSYKPFQDGNESVPVPKTFIQAQRLLDQKGINNLRVIMAHPRTIKLAAPAAILKIELLNDAGVNAADAINKKPQLLAMGLSTMQQRLDALDATGLDVPKILAVFPHVLTYAPSRVERRIRAVERVASSLRWEGDTVELLNSFPALLAYSDEKLRVHVRIFAKHGAADMMPTTVAALIIAPLEAHIIALSEEPKNYKRSVLNVQRDMKATRRKETVGSLIHDKAALEEKIGKKILRDYLSYAAKPVRGSHA